MDTTIGDDGFPLGERRAKMLRAVALEIRLNAVGHLLVATAHAAVLGLARARAVELPARRESDRAWRVTLHGLAADGSAMDLGAICGHVAECVLHAKTVLVAHVDHRDAVRLVELPLDDGAARREVSGADVARVLGALFASGTVDVANSAQPANPDPSLPLLRRLRHIALTTRDAAASTSVAGSPAHA
jgi:hypothetical protein